MPGTCAVGSKLGSLPGKFRRLPFIHGHGDKCKQSQLGLTGRQNCIKGGGHKKKGKSPVKRFHIASISYDPYFLPVVSFPSSPVTSPFTICVRRCGDTFFPSSSVCITMIQLHNFYMERQGDKQHTHHLDGRDARCALSHVYD